MELEQKKDFLLMKDWKNRISTRLGYEQWITVYHSERTDFEHISLYCCFVPKGEVEEVLKSTDWDLSYGDGTPGCNVNGFGDKRNVKYERFGTGNRIEPLVIFRDFYGIRESYVEISEEFRHYHNLYHDLNKDTFIKIHDSGEEEEVAVIQGNKIRIKLKQIRQFLAIKEMELAVFFTIDRHTTESLEELGLLQERIDEKQSECTYYFNLDSWDYSDDYKTHSRLMGKRIIHGYSKEKSGIWPYNNEKGFVDFIIGIDQDGNQLTYISNPEELANYFGTNPNAPHYLTPVFFTRNVLSKYVSQPEKYSVEDGYLRCGGLWGVQIDNNHEEYVSVFLGDLGRDMPYKEQLYWRSFNVVPTGKISNVNFKRSFLAEFADPEQKDLILKSKYYRFQKGCTKAYGWQLFEPLNEGDQHYFETLRVPLTNDQAEFDKQVLALSKIFVDSISVSNLQHYLNKSEPTKAIPLLELFLQQLNAKGYEPHIKFLRKLYELRSTGVGHRKGDNYVKAARYFQISEENLITVMEGIINQLIIFLDFLSQHCLPKE